jgi:hypothetical protein
MSQEEHSECLERGPNNRQSLPWGFLFFRNPQRCVWVNRSRFLDPTGKDTCEMKKQIHCTSTPCASIMCCTVGYRWYTLSINSLQQEMDVDGQDSRARITTKLFFGY